MVLYQGDAALVGIDKVEGLTSELARIKSTSEVYTFRWTGSGEIPLQTGMRRGDTGYNAATRESWIYFENEWLQISSPLRSLTSLKPSFVSGVNVSNGVAAGSLSIHDGMAIYHGQLIFGTTTAVTGDIRVALPMANPSPRFVYSTSGRFVDSSSGQTYQISALITGTELILRPIRTSNAYAEMAFASSTIPFTWAVGDQIDFTAMWATQFV